MKTKASVIIRDISILILFIIHANSSFSQSHHEIKWDLFGLLGHKFSLGYEIGISKKSSLEFMVGYSPSLQYSSLDTNEITPYEFSELSSIIMYKFYLDKNAHKKQGFGLAAFTEIVFRTYIDPEYKEYFLEQVGKEYKPDKPKHIFTGFQLFYKGHLWNNLYIEPSIGPSIDFRHMFVNQYIDMNFTIQVKVAYVFNQPTQDKA